MTSNSLRGGPPARSGLCPGRIDDRTLRRWKAGDGFSRGSAAGCRSSDPLDALREAEQARIIEIANERASPRRRRRGLPLHWPTRASTFASESGFLRVLRAHGKITPGTGQPPRTRAHRTDIAMPRRVIAGT